MFSGGVPRYILSLAKNFLPVWKKFNKTHYHYIEQTLSIFLQGVMVIQAKSHNSWCSDDVGISLFINEIVLCEGKGGSHHLFSLVGCTGKPFNLLSPPVFSESSQCQQHILRMLNPPVICLKKEHSGFAIKSMFLYTPHIEMAEQLLKTWTAKIFLSFHPKKK